MSSATEFTRSCLLQYRALFNWFTPVGYLSYKLLSPIAQLWLFANLGAFGGGSRAASFAVIGNALDMVATNGVFGVVMAVTNERQFGTLSLLLGSPANRAITFLSRAAVHVLDGVLGAVIGFVLAVLLFGVDMRHADLPLLVLCILLISFTTSCLGLAFGSLGLITRDTWVISNTLYYLLLVLCGINFQVRLLPAWIQLISYALPLTRGVQAARAAVAGAGLGEVSSLLLGELLVGAAYAVAGYALFRWLEHRARIGGLQEAF